MTPEQLIYLADQVASMTEVLDRFGWTYNSVPGQIPCPVHKGGHENSKSARVFPDHRIYCYTCGKQYAPTEILSVLAVISRESAAQQLLEKYPVNDETAKKLLQDFHRPRKRSAEQGLIDFLESSLRDYRHRVPLQFYRSWAKQIDALPELFTGLKVDEQKARTLAFKQQMQQELKDLVRPVR